MAPKDKKVKKPRAKPRNYELIKGSGLMRFSRARMFAKKGIYKKKPTFKADKTGKGKKELYKVKKIGGDKNGGERKVLIKKSPSLMGPERVRPYKPFKNHIPFKKHARHLRSSLTPGTIVIVLVGPHKGKRAVFLKQLDSGLLLIAGPHKINGLPMRRINQIYVIATKTKIDISGVKIPDHINDQYFKRSKKTAKKSAEPDIFASKKAGYVLSDQRKEDQKSVDKELIGVIKKHQDKSNLLGYLRSTFHLHKNQFPHRMTF
jgi:large subunit ribosomal protein L6e